MLWTAQTTYNPGDEVIYQDITYQALVENLAEVPEDSIFWIMVWEVDVKYDVGERVKYGIEEYQLIKDAPGGTLPIDTDFWVLYDNIIIQGDAETTYDLEEIAQSIYRDSESELVLPDTNNNTEVGSIMIETRGKRILGSPTIEWNDYNTPLKR